MKNSKAILFSAVMIALFSITLISGCKKEEENNTPNAHPLQSFTGTYTVTYHDHYYLAGAPPPTDVCDSTFSMLITIDTVSGDNSKMQFTVEASKMLCESQYLYYWCFAASKNSSGNLEGTSFAAYCNNSSGDVTVTSSSLSVIGTSITGSVYYTNPLYHGSSTLVPHYFTFDGIKN